jgi:imidazolonepropionase-like amidohydrolase
MRKTLLIAIAGAAIVNAQAYRFARAWDGEKMIAKAVIVVEGDRIKSIGTAAPPGRVINMSRYTAIPGMIDVHTHMTYVLDTSKLTPAGRGAATVYLSVGNAKKTLETGVTSVRNLGASNFDDIAMRDLINQGMMVGPRMFVSGYGLSIPRPNGRGGGPGTARGVDQVKEVVNR